MADWYGYAGLENIALTGPEKSQLVTELRALGPGSGLPLEVNHWRTRPDNEAELYQARFDADTLTIDNAKGWLADIFNVAVGLITSTTAAISFGAGSSTLITFGYLAINRCRLVIFGTAAGSLAQSRAEVLAYLATNAAAWGEITA